MRMLDSLVALPRRGRRDGPWLLSLALGALIAADLLAASISLFAPHRSSTQGEPQRPSRTGRVPIDVHKIAAAHLFGVFDDRGAQKRGLGPAPANLRLAGTIATENPNHGAALISGDDVPSRVYWAGQDVGGALLRSVYLDHVLLDRNGSLEILRLPKPVDRAGQQATALSASLQSAQEIPSDEPPAPQGPVQLATATIGGVRGLRIVGGKALEALRASGLGPAEVVTAINGAPLRDQDSAQRSINDMQSGPLVVTVMRRGHPTDIKVNVDDDD
jgi:type II secretion system protein C